MRVLSHEKVRDVDPPPRDFLNSLLASRSNPAASCAGQNAGARVFHYFQDQCRTNGKQSSVERIELPRLDLRKIKSGPDTSPEIEPQKLTTLKEEQ